MVSKIAGIGLGGVAGHMTELRIGDNMYVHAREYDLARARLR